MKPDWQNKSYAKTGSPIGPSTMSAKLKCGMSSLHSKISAANNNMPQAPKPVVRKFADGGTVRTRSDDEIGDTDIRTGKVDPGSYDRRMKAGEENLARLKSAAESVRSFFTREKTVSLDEPKPTMSEADVEKRQATGRFGEDMNKQPEPVKMSEPVKMPEAEKKRGIEDYISKAPVDESSDKVEPITAAVTSQKSNAKMEVVSLPAVNKKPVVVSPPVPEVKPADAPPAKTNSALEKKGLAGNEAMKRDEANRASKTDTRPASSPFVATDYYRGLDGKMKKKTPDPAPKTEDDWGTQNIKRNLQNAPGDILKGLKKAGSAIANFETLAERNSRLAKEARK